MKKMTFCILAALIISACSPSKHTYVSDVYAVDSSMAFENPENPGTFTKVMDTIWVQVSIPTEVGGGKTKYKILGK